MKRAESTGSTFQRSVTGRFSTTPDKALDARAMQKNVAMCSAHVSVVGPWFCG